jgi:type II secretion system protein G
MSLAFHYQRPVVAGGGKVRQEGFTLIELLIVVAILGIITAIAIPNLLNAIDRGRQKRSMADLRFVGTAIESYAVDQNYYPRNYSLGPVQGGVENDVEPAYIRDAPLLDGWSNDIRYMSDAQGSEYTVGSLGRDGVLDSASGGRTTDFDCDILFMNGAFVQWPEGIQT